MRLGESRSVESWLRILIIRRRDKISISNSPSNRRRFRERRKPRWGKQTSFNEDNMGLKSNSESRIKHLSIFKMFTNQRRIL
jgi:hypothetical protein